MKEFEIAHPESKGTEYYNRQLWTCLVSKCEVKAELLIKALDDKVRVNGVQAWQRLMKEADGMDDTLKGKMIEMIQYPTKIRKMEEIPVALEKWEHHIRRLKDRFGE